MYKKAFIKTIPVLTGYVFLGTAYGISIKTAGLPWWAAVFSSIFIFAGSLQFALIPIMCASFAPLTSFLMSLIINARHLFYGITMLKRYLKLRHPWRDYAIFALTDETFSLVLEEPEKGLSPEKWYTTLSGMDHFYWVLGSLIGTIAGELITLDLTGIDFSMTALFTVIVSEQTSDAYRLHRAGKMSRQQFFFPTLLGFGATLLSLLTLGTGRFLLAAMAIITCGFYLDYRGSSWRDRQKEKEVSA